MRIAFVAAGAGGMYCGSCLRDAALARAVRALGHELILVPVYTPLRLEEESGAEERVFLGAVELYLREKWRLFRGGGGAGGRRGLLARLLGSQRVLRWVSRFALSGRPEDMGRLTVSMLRGEDGNLRDSIDELARWLLGEVRPDVVHLTNLLLVGLAPTLRDRLGVPVVCGLQGEDLFLDALPAEHRSLALRIIAERMPAVSMFAAASSYYAAHAAQVFGIERDRIAVVPSGVAVETFAEPPRPADSTRPPAVGYLARIAPEKGLHILVEAFQILARKEGMAGVHLKVAGYLGGKNIAYASALRQGVAAAGLADRVEILGTLDRADKVRFLRSIDVLSVPTVYPDPKGIFVLEALACGVPVVQPAHGVFPELLEATGGGLLHAPADAGDLAEKLASLLSEPGRRAELGDRGRQATSKRFTAQRMAEATLDVYQSVLRSRP